MKIKETRVLVSGFTIIELLLIIVVVGTLGSIAIPKLLDFRQEGKESVVSAIEKNIGSAIKLQAKNALLRCGKPVGTFPSIESLRANDIVAGGDCDENSLKLESDTQFLMENTKYPPTNVINGLDTIGLAQSEPKLSNFYSGTCSTSEGAEEYGWCYNPETGDFWAATNPAYTVNAGAVVGPSSSSSSQSIIVASSSSSEYDEICADFPPGECPWAPSSSSSSVSSEPPVSSSSVSSVLSSFSSSSVSSVVSSSSSSVTSSVASSSSSSSGNEGVGGSSSSSGTQVYATCSATPLNQRLTVAMYKSGDITLPSASSFQNGGSTHYCLCSGSAAPYSLSSPSSNGMNNGNGHNSKFFVNASACNGSAPGSTDTFTNLLGASCTAARISLNGGGSSMNLTSMGVLTSGGQNYTIWRIRNPTNSGINVRLHSGQVSAVDGLSVPANSDVYVRSSVTSGAATHILTNLSTGANVTKAAGTQTFSSSEQATCIE